MLLSDPVLSAPYGGRLPSIPVLFLRCRPSDIAHHLLRIICDALSQYCVEYSYQLAADGYHGLLLLQRVALSCRVIPVQLAELRVRSYKGYRSIEQYGSQLTPTSFTYGRLSLMLP